MLSKLALNTTRKTQNGITNCLSKRYWSIGKTHETEEMYVEIDERKYMVWKNYVKGFKWMLPIIFGLQLTEDMVVYKSEFDKKNESKSFVAIIKPTMVLENFIETTCLTIWLATVWPASLFGTTQQSFHLIDYFSGNSTKLQTRFQNYDVIRAVDDIYYETAITKYGNTISPFKMIPLMWALSKRAQKKY